MDFKQALQQRGGGISNASNNNSRGSCANSIGSQSEGGNNSSCSNNSTNTGDNTSNRGSPAAPLLSCGGPSSLNNNITSRISPAASCLNIVSRPPPCDLEAHDPRLLKLARLQDPPSPLETQALINLNGSFHHSNNTTSNLSSYLSHSNHSSNHASPTSNYPSSTCSLLNGGSLSYSSPAPHSKLYPFASLEDPRHHSPFMLSAASQAALLSSARAHHASLPCFNPEPVVSLFTPEQLLEFTQQTYVFKHFAAGVTPPPTLLLPIINSVVSLGRMGAASINFGSNAGMFGVGGLRGNVDPEPGRCRRTDGKKWRCAREVVADQKYCERHMHRGRHRARANKLANTGTDGLSAPPNQTLNATPISASIHSSSGISSSTTTPFVSSTPKEPHLHFSLQPASAASTQLNRSNSLNDKLISDPAGAGLKRLLEGHNMGGAPLSSAARSVAAQPEDPPNLAELLKPNKPSFTNHILPKSQMDSTFPFTCQNSDRDADNLALRQFGDHWPRISRVADNPPANSSLSWFDQLAEEQNKRSRFNTELSIATHKSPLNLSAKFGGDQHEDIVEQSQYMGLSMALGAKVSGAAKDEERYSGRSSWVPIAWENPAIGGPLGEVLQSNGANSSGNYSGSLANNGEGCLNLIEESWEHNEGGHASSPAKDSHSPSLASPTGVLQMKASFASYSDSSSSASSPRSALKLDSANLGI